MHCSCIHQAPAPNDANSAFFVRMPPISSLVHLFMHFQQMALKQPPQPSMRLRPQYTPPFSTTSLSHLEHWALSGSQPMRVSSFFSSTFSSFGCGGWGLWMPCSFSQTSIFLSTARSGGAGASACASGWPAPAANFRRGLRLLSLVRSWCGGSERGGCAGGWGGGVGARKALPRFKAACCRSACVGGRGITSSSAEESSNGSSVAETSHLPLSATRTSVTLASVPSITDCAKASSRSWCRGAGLSQTGQHHACLGGMLRIVWM
mmetsp:Transcript_11838/g.37011  ORF Transcript_11838/g.37011 Transcript_11838/m.37011 type:complete len:263 (-) Transcript_11838:916-1704(-)